MTVQFSYIGIPCCGFPPACPCSPSPCSQQQSSPWICSLIPMLQLPVPVCTVGHMSPSRMFTDHLYSFHSLLYTTDWSLYPPPTASNASLLSQLISLSVRELPQMWESLPCFSSPPPGCRSCPHFSPPPPFFLLSYPVMWGSL